MTLKQLRFPGMKKLKPPRPTIRSEDVALAISKRIVSAVNPDDFHWEPSEIEDRIFDIQQEIMLAGYPATVIGRLWKKQRPCNDKGDRGGHPYGWDGLEQDCRAVAAEIAAEEQDKALTKWNARYGS